jgi:sortase A
MCLGYYGYQTVEARIFQREQTAAFEALLASRALTRSAEPAPALAPVPAAPAALAPPASPASPAVVGLLDIPRLNISSPVLSGDGAEMLDVAVGHLPDTPKPWESGNSAVAAHRDGLFRPLRNIRPGDDIRIRTVYGDLHYKVRDTKIVAPDDLSVLRSTDEQTLTLITCYPFNFIGHAPKRFIVHADRVPAAGSKSAVK